MLGEIGSIRLKDLEIFEEVARARSIREAARRLNTTSGQVSKSIQNLERLVGTKLFRRSVSGVLLTSQGTEMQNIVAELLLSGERMESLLLDRDKAKFKKLVAVAGTSFLTNHFTSPLVCRFAHLWPQTIFRFIDLAPDQIVPVGLRGGFEMAAHFGALDWPSTWVSRKLGKSKWVLCARLEHPLPKRPSLKQILEYPFVVPTYWTQEGLMRGNDQFPIPIGKRKAGFETATAEAAVPILQETDHIAFLPNLLIQSAFQSRIVREIKSSEIPLVEKDLYLSAKADAVGASMYSGLCDRMTESLP